MNQHSPADPNLDRPIDWGAVLTEHSRWLRMIILARVGEPQAVDEVMQEVSLAAVAQKAPIEDRAKIAPWLYRLAVTQSLMYRRKMGRRRKLVDGYTQRGELREGVEPDPAEWLLADERRELVRRALSQLHHRDAEILLLKYTENWSYRKIAEHVGASVSAVEARLHRARQRLRDELAAREVVEVPR